MVRLRPIRSVCLAGGLAAGLGASLAGCGAATPRRAPAVRVRIDAPSDGIRISSAIVTVSGQVSPGATEVEVLGRPVSARDGAFHAQVALAPGANLIDVLAGAPHANAGMAAIRVTRFVLVAVPDVLGESPATARGRLNGAGLAARTVTSPNPIEFLLPFPTQVCSTTPAAGTRVDPGSTVSLHLGKLC